jgi:hypothetical protein
VKVFKPLPAADVANRQEPLSSLSVWKSTTPAEFSSLPPGDSPAAPIIATGKPLRNFLDLQLPRHHLDGQLRRRVARPLPPGFAGRAGSHRNLPLAPTTLIRLHVSEFDGGHGTGLSSRGLFSSHATHFNRHALKQYFSARANRRAAEGPPGSSGRACNVIVNRSGSGLPVVLWTIRKFPMNYWDFRLLLATGK